MPGELGPIAVGLDRAAQVRDELRKIFASEAFKGGKRAQDFLQLVVEHALAGRLDNLRERMLGVEMFGRPVDYDTANDAVVRVKASEVRRRLAQYYGGLDSPSPVRIELPPGSYVPQFLYGRFAAPQAAAPSLVASPARPSEPIEAPQSEPAAWRRLFLLGASLLIIAAAVTVLVLWKRPGGGSPMRSIAVLPMANYSGDPKQDYFADGMTENLIAELGQISSLRVISRTSSMTYKGTGKTLPQIANELSVDSIVEGSVEREGNHVRVTTQLIDARSDRHLWAHTYDRDMTDALALQSEMAQAIAGQIRAELTPAESARLNRSQRVDPLAMDLYMRGMQQFDGVTPQDAIEDFQQSVNRDPQFAQAHAALAEAYGWAGEAGRMPYSEAFAKQRAEALKAIELDDSRPEPHLQLAFAALDQNWDWDTCRKELERARAANPNSTAVRWSYGQYLLRTGHPDQAIDEAEVALQRDPVSSHAYVQRSFILYFARRYDAALDDIQRASHLPHTPKEFDFPLGDVYAEKRMYQEAAQRFSDLGGPHALGHLGNIYARQGRTAEAQAIISQLKQEVEKSGIGRYEIAFIFAALGDKDNAFTWLERAFQARDKGILYLKIDPCLDPLRSDPRFQSLISRTGFPG